MHEMALDRFATFVLGLQIFVAGGNNVSDLFLVVPHSVQAPVYHIVTFNCTISGGQLQWAVRFSGNAAVLFWPFQSRDLLRRGVYAVNKTVSDSTLFINATEQNNGTEVQCVAAVKTFLNKTEIANLTVFGPPMAPANLSVSFLDDSHAFISWIPPFVLHGTKIRYRVYSRLVVRNNTTPALAFEGAVTTNFYQYEYHNSEVGVCLEYQFAVEAENEAGASVQSPLLDTILPTPPRFASEPSSTVMVVGSNACNVYFKLQVTFCGDLLVDYCLKLMRSAIANASLTLGQCTSVQNGSCDADIIAHLQPNAEYTYIITASNVIGNATTSAQTLYTTDVQTSTITGSDHQLNVTCFFAEGTQARGCAVCLEKSGSVLQQKLIRDNMTNTAKGVIRTEFSVDCYNISVVDWEEDGSTGLINIPTTINIIPQAQCNAKIVQNSMELSATATRWFTATTSQLLLQTSPYLQSEPTPSLSSSPPTLSPLSPSLSSSLSLYTALIVIIGIIIGAAILACFAVIYIRIGCHTKANNKIISSVTLSAAIGSQCSGTQNDPNPLTLDCDNLEMAVYDSIAMSPTTGEKMNAYSHYSALERPYSPCQSTCESNIALGQEESSYAVLESPCKSTCGPYNMNLYSELELQPNVYNSVVSNPLLLPSVPMELNDVSKNAPTPSSGTSI